ncbi:MAG: DinB family protein, partial [Actinomycetota bacterium]|nr:DinB family protein [Actinomycetota bacterium]
LGRAPAAGGWSAATVVAHLADAELVYSVRVRLVLTAERPWLVAFAEEPWAERFAPLEPDVRESLQRWRLLRDGNVRLFESLTDEEWAREGVHEERGTLSVAAIADLLAAHDREHLDQIRRALSD